MRRSFLALIFFVMALGCLGQSAPTPTTRTGFMAVTTPGTAPHIISPWAYLVNGTPGNFMFPSYLTPASDCPYTVASPMSVSAEGKIYTMGGGVSTVICYDPKSNAWTYKTPMLDIRQTGGAAAIGNKIYVIGGFDSSGLCARNEVYDVDKDTWTSLSSLPVSLSWPGVVALNGFVYFIAGGVGYTGVLKNTNYRYDPSDDSWTTEAVLPWACDAPGCSSYAGKIYACGGANLPGPYCWDNNYSYDPTTNAWTQLTSMPAPKQEMLSFAINGTIYSIGGLQNFYHSKSNDAYNIATNTWSSKADAPSTNFNQSGAILNGLVYIIGGTRGSGSQTSVWTYVPSADTWPLSPGFYYVNP